MRALTRDEVECVGGGAVMEEVVITGRRTYDWWDPSTYLLNPGGAFGTAGQNSGRPRYYSAAADAAGYFIDDYTGDYATMRDYKLALESGHGRAGGHWVQEYHKPAVPGSGDTSTFELAMALGGFMGTLVPGLEPGLIITGPVFMDKLMKWLTGN